MGLYTAHDRAIKRIQDYFYTAFAGELFSVYGWSRSRKMLYPDSTPEYVDLGSGTAGWVQAFKATCKKQGMEWLLKYYEKLPWYDSVMEFIKRKVQEGAYHKSYEGKLELIVNDINYFTKRTNRGKPASRSAG